MDPSFTLLRRYLTESSEPAFRELVERQVDLVYHVALRRAGGDHALARDAAQIVFADLARKAASLPPGTVIAGWLHRHTGFVTAKLIRTEMRRRQRENEHAIAMENNPSGPEVEALWQRLAPVLDEALGRLPTADRDALVLRFLEGRGLREVGGMIGLTENSARMRVTRALEKMRLLLRRRGITSTSLALGSALVLARTAEAPGGLAQAVAAGALQAAPASAAAGLASLAWWAKAAMGLGLVAVVGIPVRNWMAEQPVAVLAETPVAVRPVVAHQAPPVVAGRSRLDGLGQPLFPPALAPVSVPATVPVPVPAVPSFPEPPLEMAGQTTALVVPVPDTGEIAKLILGVVPAVMKFFPETFSVKAGQRVMILFKNEKCPLQHNFLLVNPGKLAEVGALADQMLTDPQAMAKLYVPDSPDILAEGTKLLGIGQSDLVEFTAPAEPGEYPFLCTFPGHWRLMNGILTVSP